MSTNTTPAATAANLNQTQIIAEIVAAIDSRPVPACGYRYVDPRDVAAAVENIARQITRSEAAAALYRSQQLRETFKRFDGKVINRRFWAAVDSACYDFMPAAPVWKNCRGEEIKPAAVWLTDGRCYAAEHFARVYWSAQAFGGASVDSVIYGRCADWRTCAAELKTEYKIVTGERLDASRALAVLDYEATTEEAHAAELRAALADGARLVSDYVRTVETLAAMLDGIPYAFRDAFGLGARRTLPTTIHN